MKTTLILFLFVALTSCSSFDRMKYRHLRKVPAGPIEFGISEKYGESCRTDSMLPLRTEAIVLPQSEDSIYNNFGTTPALIPRGTESQVHTIIPIAISPKHPVSSHALPIKRDWSLLIGSLLVIGGLMMLALCIFYYPFAGISFLWMIAFELGTVYAAWRMIGTGVTYFLTRFRSKRNFSER